MQQEGIEKRGPKKNPKIEKIRKDGISVGFQIIFNQIVGKGIKQNEIFQYTAKRLRDFKEIVDKNKMKQQIQKQS